MKEQTRHSVPAPLHGMISVSLFRKLDYPGAPAEFIDLSTVEDIIASREF